MRKNQFNLLGIIILIIIIGLFFGFSWANKTPEEIKHLAAEQAAQEIYWNNNLDNIQPYINIITKKEDWQFSSEIIDWNKTKNINFPFTLNITWIFHNPKNREELYGYEQLFLFDSNRDIWLPLATEGSELINGEIKTSTKNDLWDPINDWIKIFQKEPLTDREP